MVIQRIQSVLLLLAAVVMGVFSFTQIAQIQTPDYTFSMTALSLASEGIPTDGAQNMITCTWFFFTLSILTALISLIDIFLFKNLPLQRKLCWVNIILLIAVYAVTWSVAYTVIPGEVSWNYTILCAPLLAIIATWLASKRIKADENLLKSADRIR